MRYFKFRVWDVNEKCFLPSSRESCMYINFNGHVEGISTVGEPIPMNEDDYIIISYTGMKDKNGKEIYEGDIVKLFNDPDELYEVVYNDFDNDIVGFLLEADGGRGDWFAPRKREVMGNIFENPELVK